MLYLALALPALVTAYVAYAPAEGSGAFVNGALQNILKNTDKTDKYRYPTDFTRGIEPVSIDLIYLPARSDLHHSRNHSTATMTTGVMFPFTVDLRLVPSLQKQMSG